jgi:hypothetical protein
MLRKAHFVEGLDHRESQGSTAGWNLFNADGVTQAAVRSVVWSEANSKAADFREPGVGGDDLLKYIRVVDDFK